MHDSSNATSAAAAAAAAVGVKGQPGQGAPDLLTGMTGRLCHLSAIGSGQEAFEISRAGSGQVAQLNPTRPASSAPAREKLWYASFLLPTPQETRSPFELDEAKSTTVVLQPSEIHIYDASGPPTQPTHTKLTTVTKVLPREFLATACM